MVSGTEVSVSFLTHLEEGGADIPMETPEVGAKIEREETPTSSSPGPLVSPSLSPPRVPQEWRMPQKVIVSKSHRSQAHRLC